MVSQEEEENVTTPWMTMEEAARYVRKTVPTFRRLVRQGVFTGHKASGSKRPRYLFLKEELDRDLLTANAA